MAPVYLYEIQVSLRCLRHRGSNRASAQQGSLESPSCLALSISAAPSPASLPSSSRYPCCSPCLCTCCSLFLECHSLPSYLPTSSVLKASSNAPSSATPFPTPPTPILILTDCLLAVPDFPGHTTPCPLAPVVMLQCQPSPDLSSSVACGKSSLTPTPGRAPSPGRKSRCIVVKAIITRNFVLGAGQHCWTDFHLAASVCQARSQQTS